jgi:hypothetical protein
MQANFVNGWREVLARVFDGFTVEYGVTPEWLVNPGTNRRLKLDYLFTEIGLAVRFVGLEGTARPQRKSDEEIAEEAAREDARATVCRAHGVVLVSIDPDGEPRIALRDLELGLTRASSQLVQNRAVSQAQKQKLMPRLSQARRRAGEFTTRLTAPERLNLYAEMWWDRQAALAAQAPARKPPARCYEVGMEVEHVKFGPGQVTAVEPEGSEVKVTVDFIESGVRNFYAGLMRDKLFPFSSKQGTS